MNNPDFSINLVTFTPLHEYMLSRTRLRVEIIEGRFWTPLCLFFREAVKIERPKIAQNKTLS